jgi:integrase
MAQKINGLTAREVQTLKTPGLHGDGNGLYLKIAPTGAKVWIHRYQIAGRRRDMGLGSAAVVTLAEAREKAREVRRLVAEGVDPIEQRVGEAAAAALAVATAMTFRQCAEAYIASMRAGWKNAKHGSQWSSTLENYAFPVMGELPIAAIDIGLVLRVLEPIWPKKTETASRLRGRIESILDYAKVRGYRDGENPARWKGHLDHILPAKAAVAKVRHHPSMPYADLPGFWPRLQVQDGLAARALELCILTATRTSELLGARWAEIDMDTATWTIPAERMKADVEHRVPLSDAALALLRKLASIRVGDHVFPGQSSGRPLSQMAMLMVTRRMSVAATPHGFRSTFRTWAAEQTAFPFEVAEAALAHTQGDKTVAAYQRGDMFEKRRQLMAAWATYCTTPRAAGKVVSIRA